MDDYSNRAHGHEHPAPAYADSNWAAYSSMEDRVTLALRRWVQGMEEALAKAAIRPE